MFNVTLVIASKTSSGEELLERLREKAAQDGQRLFIAVVPQQDGSGTAPREARARLARMLDRLQSAGLLGSGMIGDPDPYTATINALELFTRRRRGHLDAAGRAVGLAAREPDRACAQRHLRAGRARGRRRAGNRDRGAGRIASASDGGSQHLARGRARGPRRPPAGGEQKLAGGGAAARDAAFHHLRDDGLRGLLHRLLLHPHRPGSAMAGAGHPPAGARGGRQHGDPRVLLVHAALGADVDQERQPLRLEGRHPARPSCWAAPSCSSRSTSTRTSASRPRTMPSRRSSTRSPGCTAPTCSSGCCCC